MQHNFRNRVSNSDHRQNFSQLSLAGALLAGLLLTGPGRAEDWPQWRGPHRDGISQEKGWQTEWPASGPKKLWEVPVGIGYSSMSVAKGRVYTMGNEREKDIVSCLDAETGQVIWKHEYDCLSKDPNGYHGTRSTPTVDGNRVYTVSRHGHLFCLDAATGKVVWSKDFKRDFGGEMPKWGWAGSVLIEKDWALTEIGGGGVSVVAFNKASGEVVWKNGDDGAGYSSLMPFDVGGERCLTVFTDKDFVGRRMKDGSELWRLEWKTSYGVNAATPIIVGDKMFISSGYNYGCALLEVTASNVKEAWRNKDMRNHVNSCVLYQGYLYGFDDKKLACLDWNTGQTRWEESGYGKGSLILADGKLIIWSDQGKLAVANASPQGFQELSGAEILEGKNTWAHPVLANGRIYVRNLDHVACLDVKR